MKGNWEPRVLQALQTFENIELEYESERLKYQTIQNRNYIPDWVVTLPSGRKVYIEAKGYLRPDDTVKLRRVKETYPEKDIRLVFEKDNKFSKKSPTRYSDWCRKYGFPFCVGAIPEDWFTE